MKTLFICRGNIGRSQMAKVIYNTLSKNGDSADCCGTRVNEFEGQKIADIKNDSVEDDIRAMKEIGFDISECTRKQITPDLLNWADQIIVMAERDTWPDYLEINKKIILWEIENPKGVIYEKTCEIRDIIKQKVEEILK
jgi:protein-tyrosine-phosphatase